MGQQLIGLLPFPAHNEQEYCQGLAPLWGSQQAKADMIEGIGEDFWRPVLAPASYMTPEADCSRRQGSGGFGEFQDAQGRLSFSGLTEIEIQFEGLNSEHN